MNRMNTKLTLNIDRHVIERARLLATETGGSFSKLIENYLRALTEPVRSELTVTPLVRSLTGVIPEEEVDQAKKERLHHLAKKYA